MNEWVRDLFRVTGLMSGATAVLGVLTAVGYWAGHKVGLKWGIEPWGTAVGVLLGLGAGFLQIWDIYRRHLRQ